MLSSIRRCCHSYSAKYRLVSCIDVIVMYYLTLVYLSFGTRMLGGYDILRKYDSDILESTTEINK